MTRTLDRVRKICLALPEVTERLSHGSPAFYVRGTTTLAHAWVNGHHDHTFPHLWLAAPPVAVRQQVVPGPSRWM